MKSSSHSSYYKTSLIALVVIVCLIFVISSSAFFSQKLSNASKQFFSMTKSSLLQETTKVIGATVGTPMQKDAQWNINVLIVGYGGGWHQGGYLADSIMVASFDPQEYSVSMISIPRDLIVNMSGSIHKINSVMAYGYSRTKEVTKAAQILSAKVTEITGLEIPYYALIDFDGFAHLIDAIGGVEVDVPQTIVDRRYPGPRWTYTTFSIQKWLQYLDGATALKYARSRYSSSDFSRSHRQQLIIQAILKKLTGDGLSIGSLQTLYEMYQQYVKTNITVDEVLGLLEYGTTVPRIHSFGYTYECSANAWKTMKPACLLYPVEQALFNGMSGMLPIGASLGKISQYGHTKTFADFVVYHQGIFNEGFTVSIHSPKTTVRMKTPLYTLASQLAVKMKRYGISIQDVVKSEQTIGSGTVAVIVWEWSYDKTIKTLWEFVHIDEVKLYEATVDGSGNVLPNHIDIFLGEDFMHTYANKKFSTYRDHAQ